MRLNKNKHIGRVLFIVEGSHTEFLILRRIFIFLFEFTYDKEQVLLEPYKGSHGLLFTNSKSKI